MRRSLRQLLASRRIRISITSALPATQSEMGISEMRMRKALQFLQPGLLPFALFVSHLASQQPVPLQRNSEPSGMPSSGGYHPPALSLAALLETDHAINEALMTFTRTGDGATYKSAVFQAAQAGDLAAELLLAEQYIPEQCAFEPNQDVPHCGKNGNEPPQVIFRNNPLGIEASYEEAAQWLEKASAQGSGEASEVLAQLITRMLANGHRTPYTIADSTRFHALARSRGFDVEAITVTCYKLSPGANGITVGSLPRTEAAEISGESFTQEELQALSKAGFSGSLSYGGSTGGGDSVLLMRPEGAVVHVRIILDHDPGAEVLLPMPAHHDEIYVQRGDQFLAFPGGQSVLPRFIAIESRKDPATQITVFAQLMSGAYSGTFCTQFP
jgi:hypothetical protein